MCICCRSAHLFPGYQIDKGSSVAVLYVSCRTPLVSTLSWSSNQKNIQAFYGAFAIRFSGTIVGAKGSLSKKLNLPAQFSRVTFGRKHLVLPCLKASETSSVSISDVCNAEKTYSEKTDSEKIEAEKTEAVQKGVFPSGLENMLKDICNGTTIAEVKLKVGDFQMYLKREVEQAPVESTPLSMTEPPVTPQQEIEATHYTSSEEQNPFENFSDTEKELASMQEHESISFGIVASPTVGVFFRSKNEKGKRLPSVCEEGMIIKEGQIIGFINQFNNDVPIRANVAGKVIRFLCKNGVVVGYGDPLLTILPASDGSEIEL